MAARGLAAMSCLAAALCKAVLVEPPFLVGAASEEEGAGAGAGAAAAVGGVVAAVGLEAFAAEGPEVFAGGKASLSFRCA